MRQPSLAVAIKNNVFNAPINAGFESVAQTTNVLRSLIQLLAGKFCCRTKSNDTGDSFRAGSSFSLLMPADILSDQTHASANVQRSRSFRRIKLMSRQRKQIATQPFHSKGNSSGSLHGVCVKPEMAMARSAFFANQGANLLNRLNRSDFVVRKHYRDEDCVGLQGSANIFKPDNSIPIDRQPSNFPAALLQSLTDR